jgi:PAS domain S-box-containing protein
MAVEASSIRVLHVDDDAEFRELTAEFLERMDDRLEVVTAESSEAGLSRLETESVDCIVSDQDMPGMDGLELLRRIRESHPDLPFILFTGKGSEEIASDAITAGVSDYLRKGSGSEQYELLANRIENAVAGYRASRAAERAQRRLRELAANAKDVLWIYDGEWDDLVFVNSAYEKIWEQSRESLHAEPTSFLDAVHPEDRERVEAAVERAGDGESLDLEFRLEGADGTERWVWVQAEPIMAGDDVERIVGFTRDITARRQREREREQYKRIVDAMGDGVYAVDEEGEYIDINEYMAALSGYEEEEWREGAPSQFLDDEDVERFERAIADLLSADTDGGVRTVEATLHTADGERIPIEANLTLLPREDGEFRGTVGVVRDISERRDRERELEQYETIVTAIPDEVYTIDAAGYFTSVIPPAGKDRTTTGYDPDELIGEHVSVLMDADDIEQGERLIEDLLSDPDRERGSFEMEVVTRDGDRIPNENHIALLPMDDGEFRGTVGVLRDITERKERERQLRQQNERLEAFVGVVSHDLRNPLNVARGRLEFVQEDCDSDHLDHIDRAHDRMETLIDDLLTLAQEGEAVRELEPVALDAVVRDCWATVATANATLQVETGLTVQADRGRLQQLLENLITNAVEHGSTSAQQTEDAVEHGSTSPDSQARRDTAEHDSTSPDSQARRDADGAGSVEPSVTDAPEDAAEHGSTDSQDGGDAGPDVTVTVGPLDDEGRMGFFIADDGPGIPEADRDRVFESGYSTAPDGTGFGLPIVAEIADAHGWSVTVTESESGGARFEIAGVETGD